MSGSEKNINGRSKPWASLILSAAALLIWFMPSISYHLEYEREKILSFEFWRLLTCHFTHFSIEHLFWDLVVFIILGVVCELKEGKTFLILVVVSGAAISLVNILFLQDLLIYRGLSGIDSALFGWLCAALFAESISRKSKALFSIAALITIFFCVKIGMEAFFDKALFVSSDEAVHDIGVSAVPQDQEMVPVPLAHVVGIVVGAAVHFVQTAINKHR